MTGNPEQIHPPLNLDQADRAMLARPGLGLLGQLLDRQEIAACYIDNGECVQTWNEHYLIYFAEHRGEIQPGESYTENLRRYFRVNSGVTDPDQFDMVVAEGLRRHRELDAPSMFQKQDGRLLQPRTIRFADGGCLKCWADVTDPNARMSLGSGPSGIVHFRPDGSVLGLNQMMQDVFLGLVDTLSPQPHYRTQMLTAAEMAAEPEDAAVFLELANRTWPIAATRPDAFIHRHRDGRWFRMDESRRFDGGLVVSWTDISDYRTLESTLQRERDVASMQRNFVAMASHQFRTPLSIIDVNAQLLQPQRGHMPGVDELKQRLERIRRTVARLVGLIEVMLGAASAESGTIETRIVPADLKRIVEEACDRAQEVAPTRVFERDLAGLPANVPCDARLIDQVIGNLLSNAVKYSPKRDKIVVKGSTEGQWAVVQVTDFGVGIAPDDQPQVFERFFRAVNARNIAGTGIGLTLARHIIDLHHGDIAVASELGRGSTFTLRLPLQTEQSTTQN